MENIYEIIACFLKKQNASAADMLGLQLWKRTLHTDKSGRQKQKQNHCVRVVRRWTLLTI